MTQRHSPKLCRHPVYLHHPACLDSPYTRLAFPTPRPPTTRTRVPTRCRHVFYHLSPTKTHTYTYTIHIYTDRTNHIHPHHTHTLHRVPEHVTTSHAHTTSHDPPPPPPPDVPRPSTPRRRSCGARGHTTSDDSSRPRSPRLRARGRTARSTGHDPSIDPPLGTAPPRSSPLCDSR